MFRLVVSLAQTLCEYTPDLASAVGVIEGGTQNHQNALFYRKTRVDQPILKNITYQRALREST